MNVVNTKYFQKSTAFLFPLTLIERELPNINVISYLNNIDEYELLVDCSNCSREYLKKCINNTKNKAEIEENVFLFDLIEYQKDIDLFLNGEYSKFTEKTKQIICKYWGFHYIPKKAYLDTKIYTVHTALYPEYYYEYASKQFGVSIKDGELTSKFDSFQEIR